LGRKKELSMDSALLDRQVLILTDDVSFRNLFYLMRRVAVENAESGGARAMTAIAEREEYDAVVLDLRCREGLPGSSVYGVGNIQSSTVERMLTIIAEVDGPATPALIEQYIFSGLPEAHQWLASRCQPSQLQIQPC
jgi:hypothetical protein